MENVRAGGRFKSLREVESTPKASSGNRKTRFGTEFDETLEPNQHPTINISANQV